MKHLATRADDTVSTRTDAGSLTDGSAWTELASGSFVAAAIEGRVR